MAFTLSIGCDKKGGTRLPIIHFDYVTSLESKARKCNPRGSSKSPPTSQQHVYRTIKMIWTRLKLQQITTVIDTYNINVQRVWIPKADVKSEALYTMYINTGCHDRKGQAKYIEQRD
jgi:hypothetical protein